MKDLLRLQNWFSPSFPIGGYAYSHGLEAALEAGAVRDGNDLLEWIRSVLSSGSGRVDAFFFRRAAAASTEQALLLAAEGRAWAPTMELALESELQGDAFLNTVRTAWPHPALDGFAERLDGRPPLAVAAGFACGSHGVEVGMALAFFLQSLAAGIVSAGQRAIPLGQAEAQSLAAALEPVILETAGRSEMEPFTAAPTLEIFSMRHETQYSRIFRS